MRFLAGMLCAVALCGSPAAPYEVLFLGTPAKNANGTTGQVVTALMNYQKTADGAEGLIDHSDLQSGFSAQFTVNCQAGSVYLVAAPWTDQPQPPKGSGLTLQIFSEGAEVTFGDGQVGSIGLTADDQLNIGAKRAADIGGNRYSVYVAKKRTRKSLTALDVATGETGLIVSEHPQLVAMLGMTLLARTCSPAH